MGDRLGILGAAGNYFLQCQTLDVSIAGNNFVHLTWHKGLSFKSVLQFWSCTCNQDLRVTSCVMEEERIFDLVSWSQTCGMGQKWCVYSSYLPGVEVNRDHEGGSSRVRPFHCTSVGLTPTITPNVGNSNASFLIVGDCVRAIPF